MAIIIESVRVLYPDHTLDLSKKTPEERAKRITQIKTEAKENNITIIDTRGDQSELKSF